MPIKFFFVFQLTIWLQFFLKNYIERASKESLDLEKFWVGKDALRLYTTHDQAINVGLVDSNQVKDNTSLEDGKCILIQLLQILSEGLADRNQEALGAVGGPSWFEEGHHFLALKNFSAIDKRSGLLLKL